MDAEQRFGMVVPAVPGTGEAVRALSDYQHEIPVLSADQKTAQLTEEGASAAMGYLYGLKALLEIVNSALAEYLLVAVLAGYTLYSFWGKVHSTARVHKTTFLLLLATLVCFGWSFFQNAGFNSLRIVGKYLSCVLIFFLVSVELGEKRRPGIFLK